MTMYATRKCHQVAAMLVSLLCLVFSWAPTHAWQATPSPASALLDDATVALYSGSCPETLGEPLLTLGTLEHRDVVPVPVVTGADDGDDDIARSIRLLGEDINENGELDPGEDVNGNGRLDPGLLANDEVVPASAIAVTDVSDAWILEVDVTPPTVASPDDDLSVVVFQEAGAERQLVACGEGSMQPAGDNNAQLLYIHLVPVTGGPLQNIAGYVRPQPTDVDPEVQPGIQIVVFEIPGGAAVPSPASQ